MKHGIAFSRLLTKALEVEEEELKKLGALNSKQSVQSIRAYNESWLSVPLLKQAIIEPSTFELFWERGKVDICFLESKQPVATFELKGPFPARPKREYLRKIHKDFKKQYAADQMDGAIEHYVVLIPWGPTETIDEWTGKRLEDEVREECPTISINESPDLEPIKLNKEPGEYTVVKVFRVVAL